MKKKPYLYVVLTGLNSQGLGPGWMDVEWAMHVVREGRRMYLCVRMLMVGTHSGLGGRGGGV